MTRLQLGDHIVSVVSSPNRTKSSPQLLYSCNRCIPLLAKDKPVALPCQQDTLCSLICLSKAASKQSKGDISMAVIQTAAAEVHVIFSQEGFLTRQLADPISSDRS